jgi:pyruvate ferredoxin oxidoreductase alpha subunit
MLMGEVLFMTSGCRLPVVMAVANRSLSAPVNIWGDQQDSLVLRDSGWIQLYSASVQEAYDNVLQAYRIAEDERVCLPVMVCYDGFYISHVSETVETLTQEQADEFLPSNETPGWTVLDVDNPFQLNQLLPPVAYSEYQYRKHSAMLRAREVAAEVGEEFGEKFGRNYGLLDSYQCEDAEFIMVGIGSLTGTAKWVVNKLRGRGEKAGMVGIRMFRPFPEKEFAEVTKGARALIVFDRAIGFGTCGMLYYDVTRVLYHLEKKPMALNFIVGLGGRDVTPEFIEHSYFRARMVVQDGLQDTTQTLFWPDADLEGLR